MYVCTPHKCLHSANKHTQLLCDSEHIVQTKRQVLIYMYVHTCSGRWDMHACIHDVAAFACANEPVLSKAIFFKKKDVLVVHVSTSSRFFFVHAQSINHHTQLETLRHKIFIQNV